MLNKNQTSLSYAFAAYCSGDPDYYYKHFDWTKKIKTALFYLKFVQESFYSILC